ncbi:PAS domain S-box protein [Chitinophaga rhizosphaerae]|uniref:PAS domain S-box protein n=1 Tax=Chitinophaga rhizosphaerae TaxID=1864947 RepID=UPI000F801542|nr:PAS domain S-box protein [Chitinophaga rhizosphaerae]
MNKPPVPQNEAARLRALRSYNILDTFREEEYEKLTDLASRICGMPISLVTLIDENRQWIKAKTGLDVGETPRSESICQYTISHSDLFEVNDASKDTRFKELPGVSGDEHIRYYAGYPLIDREGFALGALCVLDRKPGVLNREQKESLKLLAEMVVSLIVERRKNIERSYFEQLFELSQDLMCIVQANGFYRNVNPAFTKTLGWEERELMMNPILYFAHPDDVEIAEKNLTNIRGGKDKVNFTRRFRTKTGAYRLIQWAANSDPDTGDIFAIGRDITDERIREELLEQSQKKLSAFFEHSQGLMCTHDLRGKIISVNYAGANLLGYTVAEMSKMNLADLLPETHRFEFTAYLQEIRDKGMAAGQMTTVHRNGTRRIWMFSNVLETGQNEEPYVIGNAIDITERYLLEKDLARTKEMLEQTNAVARVGAWVAEVPKNKLYWADMTRELHGVPHDFEPDLQAAIGFFKKGEHQNKVIRAVNRAIRTGRSFDLEVLIVTWQGEERWVRTQGHADFENGVCKRLYGAFQDINDKKKAELEISSSRKLLQEVLQSASEVSIIATDKTGVVTLFNRGAERLLGYTSEEMIGKVMAHVIHDKEEVEARARELSEETGENVTPMRAFIYKTEREGSEQREWIYVKKDGSRCIVSLVMTPIRDIRNQVTGYLGIATDITKRKRMEQALIASKQQAEQMSSAKSEFLANMSHEIRTPLNGIIGFTDLIMKTKLNGQQQQYLNIVHQSANVLLSIINDILDLSKIEAGKLELHNEKVKLYGLGQEAIDIITYQGREKGLDIRLCISPQLPAYIHTDALRLKQVLVNLLGNAVKFTEKGMVELRISSIAVARNGDTTFKFEVRDTGIGIKPDKQERIFEAFAQEDASTTKKYGGTGIGLAISNKILALMGSKLQLISYPGSGSIFYFYVTLPVEQGDAADDATAGRDEGQPEVSLEHRQVTVLVVEDNTVNMLLTKTIIHKLMPSAAIIEAGNGLDAVRIFRDTQPDLILMDIQIPELNGYEATYKIRAMESDGRVPIIALTAGNISGEREKSFSAGMDDFLPKPIVEETLAAILRKWLPDEQSADAEARNDAAADISANQHFDISVLKSYLGDDDDVSKDILLLTASELDKSLEALEQFVEEGNLKGVKSIGHKLYGTSASVGMRELARLARVLDMLTEFEPGQVKALWQETRDEIALVKELLKKEIER